MCVCMCVWLCVRCVCASELGKLRKWKLIYRVDLISNGGITSWSKLWEIEKRYLSYSHSIRIWIRIPIRNTHALETFLVFCINFCDDSATGNRQMAIKMYSQPGQKIACQLLLNGNNDSYNNLSNNVRQQQQTITWKLPAIDVHWHSQ